MSENGHDMEHQALPAPVDAKPVPAIDQITGHLKGHLEELHKTMFGNLDVRKDYIDQLKGDLDARYNAIVSAINSYGEYVKLAGEKMDRHDAAMERIASNAGVVEAVEDALIGANNGAASGL